MSRKDYPVFGDWRGMKKNTIAKCDAIGCDKLATKRQFVQISYMRGDDECMKCCDDHGSKGRSCEDFCKLFPPEAWK